MREGRVRSDVPYVWPASLLRPADTQLIYLDLNHWIGLAKAATGHPDGKRYADALASLRQRRGEVVLPLAIEHYMEMTGIALLRHRIDVAAVMEELSGFACILPGATIIDLELEAAVAQLTGTPERWPPVPLLGRGVLRAFGRKGGLRIENGRGEDVTDIERARWRDGPAAFDEWRADAERRLDRAVLRGPTPEDEPQLRALGWDPTVARAGAERRAQQEREQADRFAADPHFRRERVRDAVGARYLGLEVNDAFTDALAVRGLTPRSLLHDVHGARRFTDSMPSADARVSLLTAAHRNPQTKWTRNDMFDIDALSVATPYCDIVVTERHAHHVLHQAGLPERLRTEVLATPEELVTALAAERD